MVVAHRGASYDRAEHTLAAYVAAIDSGADALECDVRLTRDGHLVCVHDRTVQRTSNGRGVVSELDLAGLRALDFASWHDQWPDSADQLLTDDAYLAGVAPDRLEPDGGVLLLDTLLGLVRDSARDVKLLIETKHPTRYAGLVERRLVRLLDEFGWAGADSPARVMSFSWVALRRIRRQAPDLELVMLVDSRTAWYRTRPFVDHDWGAGPGIEMVREHPELIARIADHGTRVSCWVVNDEADVDLCLELGIDGIITDRPGAVVTYLTQSGRRV